MNLKKLVKQFEKAGLRLKILDKPIRTGKGMHLIFQMDINLTRCGSNRYEEFRMYPGGAGVSIQVRDADPPNRQVLLLVKEPVQEFEDSLEYRTKSRKKQIVEAITNQRGVSITRITAEAVYFTQKTPSTVRYFLMGVDERQLFISQLARSSTTIAAARKSLGASVKFAEGSRRNSVNRQGEWFFLETSRKRREEINLLVNKNRVAIVNKVNIGDHLRRRGGNPHTVDELVVIPDAFLESSSESKRIRGTADKVFIRGAVRHKDHKTIKFNHWREVVANNEGGDRTGSMTSAGIFWID